MSVVLSGTRIRRDPPDETLTVDGTWTPHSLHLPMVPPAHSDPTSVRASPLPYKTLYHPPTRLVTHTGTVSHRPPPVPVRVLPARHKTTGLRRLPHPLYLPTTTHYLPVIPVPFYILHTVVSSPAVVPTPPPSPCRGPTTPEHFRDPNTTGTPHRVSTPTPDP